MDGHRPWHGTAVGPNFVISDKSVMPHKSMMSHDSHDVP